MMTVLNCIVQKHNIWLVIVAVLLCVAGSWVTARLFLRTTISSGLQRLGWHFLTALAAGVAIWCTHFVAMIGFDAGVAVGFDPVLTIISLLIAIVGSTVGFILAGSGLARFAPALGGAVVGLAIAAMHYTGMMAYRVQGILSWDMHYLVASIGLSVVFSAIALHFAMRPDKHAPTIMAVLLALAIALLHFTGMTALRVEPLLIDNSFSDPDALHALALAVAGMALVIVGAGLVSYLIDDSTRTESLGRLRLMALSDMLTSLPNRTNFNERLDFEMELARNRGGRFALIGIDLNRFKEINDLRGHNAGDEVLRILGRRMKGLLREDHGEFIARIGGDEFSAIHRLDEGGHVSEFLTRLEKALFTPLRIDDFEVIPGASFGIAIYPDDANTKPVLINNADLAMYRAKVDPLKKICFYEPSMDEAVRARRSLAVDLRNALKNNQLSLHYQVQTLLSTNEIRGYEALLRWRHPRQGFVPPSEFIPIAEENGLILQIGEWVLRQACMTAATWEPFYKVAVNLSAVQFAHSDLPRLIMAILVETGLSPERLEIELTESTIFADRERALHTLRQIKDLGVSVALDDFGTGYSSLDTLRSFPFDKIKLDRSFMSESTPQARAIIRAVLALGKSLKIPVLAEGIETQEQLSMLTMDGCDEAQGFLLGRPAPLDEIVASGRIRLVGNNRLKETPRNAVLQTGLSDANSNEAVNPSPRAALTSGRDT
jgi:diguanylate cyclase (GGDEF)-like protein